MSESTGAYLVGRWQWLLRQLGQRVWVRATMFSLAAVAVALLAAWVGPYVPTTWELSLAAGSVDNILAILASSMLAVTTFSLSIMVSAYSAAATNVTPRATKLLITDSVATTTLSTFVGSFLFSIVGIIGLSANIYGEKGRIILFVATLVVIFMVTAALLRWIDELGYFGRVGDTIRRVEKEAKGAARNWGRLPRLGAQPAVPIPPDAAPIFAERAGYVTHIDVSALSEIAEANETEVHIVRVPGRFTHPNRPLAYTSPKLESDARADAISAFTVSDDRNYDQDPRYGLVVLSEIASRALSPAVNDPGTAIGVLASGVRVFLAFCEGHDDAQKVRFERLHAPELQPDEMLQDFFDPIARDGAGLVEVQLRLQAALEAVALGNAALFGETARRHAALALAQAKAAGMLPREEERLEAAASWRLPEA